LLDLPSFPQPVVNAAAGFGDGVSRVLTFGLTSTSLVRAEWGIDGGVDACSASYKGGKYTGYAWGALTFGAGGLNGGANSMFWSGQGARGLAAISGTTLDQTLIGGFLASVNTPTWLWKAASVTFALNATDPAAAVILFENSASIWALEARILAWRGVSVIR
jgi:hypothetical protein